MIYINTLLLSQANEIIGFNDARKIIDSIYYFVWYQGNFNSVKSLSDTENEIVDRLIEGVLHSPYHSLCSYCDSKGGVNKTEFIFLFEELTNNIKILIQTRISANITFLCRKKQSISMHWIFWVRAKNGWMFSEESLKESKRRKNNMFNYLIQIDPRLYDRYLTVERNIKSASNSFYDSFLDMQEQFVKTVLIAQDIELKANETCGAMLKRPEAKEYFVNSLGVDDYSFTNAHVR